MKVGTTVKGFLVGVFFIVAPFGANGQTDSAEKAKTDPIIKPTVSQRSATATVAVATKPPEGLTQSVPGGANEIIVYRDQSQVKAAIAKRQRSAGK